MARNRRRPETRKNFIGWSLILFTISMFMFFWYIKWYVSTSHIEVDLQTFCPKSGALAATVVLLDQTDSLNQIQAASIRSRLFGLRDEVGKHELFSMYTVDATDQGLLSPVLEICNPGDGADLSQLTGNPRLAQKRWNAGFSGPVTQALEKVLLYIPSNRSPIMESLQSLGIEPLRRKRLTNVPKRLIVISDMLQHTHDISHYKGLDNYQTAKNGASYMQVRADLNNVSVEIWYLRRMNGNQIQGRSHIEFWQQYIEGQGGRLEKVISIEG